MRCHSGVDNKVSDISSECWIPLLLTVPVMLCGPSIQATEGGDGFFRSQDPKIEEENREK